MKKLSALLASGMMFLSPLAFAESEPTHVRLRDVPPINPAYVIGSGFLTEKINNRNVLTMFLILGNNTTLRKEHARYFFRTVRDIDDFAHLALIGYKEDKNRDGDYRDEGEVMIVNYE